MAGELALGDACNRGQRLVQGFYPTEGRDLWSSRPGKCASAGKTLPRRVFCRAGRSTSLSAERIT